MNTIALCFKPLLYPQPVVLKYLPTLLKLSLPGVDASDAVRGVFCVETGWLGWCTVVSGFMVSGLMVSGLMFI